MDNIDDGFDSSSDGSSSGRSNRSNSFTMEEIEEDDEESSSSDDSFIGDRSAGADTGNAARNRNNVIGEYSVRDVSSGSESEDSFIGDSKSKNISGLGRKVSVRDANSSRSGDSSSSSSDDSPFSNRFNKKDTSNDDNSSSDGSSFGNDRRATLHGKAVEATAASEKYNNIDFESDESNNRADPSDSDFNGQNNSISISNESDDDGDINERNGHNDSKSEMSGIDLDESFIGDRALTSDHEDFDESFIGDGKDGNTKSPNDDKYRREDYEGFEESFIGEGMNIESTMHHFDKLFTGDRILSVDEDSDSKPAQDHMYDCNEDTPATKLQGITKRLIKLKVWDENNLIGSPLIITVEVDIPTKQQGSSSASHQMDASLGIGGVVQIRRRVLDHDDELPIVELIKIPDDNLEHLNTVVEPQTPSFEAQGCSAESIIPSQSNGAIPLPIIKPTVEIPFVEDVSIDSAEKGNDVTIQETQSPTSKQMHSASEESIYQSSKPVIFAAAAPQYPRAESAATNASSVDDESSKPAQNKPIILEAAPTITPTMRLEPPLVVEDASVEDINEISRNPSPKPLSNDPINEPSYQIVDGVKNEHASNEQDPFHKKLEPEGNLTAQSSEQNEPIPEPPNPIPDATANDVPNVPDPARHVPTAKTDEAPKTKGLEPFVIPSIISVTYVKTLAHQKVGLAFRKTKNVVIIDNVAPGSAFDGSALRAGQELLCINRYRIRSARRAAEIVR